MALLSLGKILISHSQFLSLFLFFITEKTCIKLLERVRIKLESEIFLETEMGVIHSS